MKYIIGIGSHAEVVYSILTAIYPNDEIKFLSYPSKVDNVQLSLPLPIKDKYQGGIDELTMDDVTKHEFIIGIGDNKKREEVAFKYNKLVYINAIHQKAHMTSTVIIGVGNVICPGVVIQTNTKIGDHNIINTNSSIDHHNNITNFCHVAPNCALCGNVTLFDGVFIGVGSAIVPHISIKPWSFIKANSLIKNSTAPIQMYEPYIDKYKTSALDAINSGWISSHGKYVKLATEKLKQVLNAKYVILVNNGTSATHCLFLALKYKYPNINKIYVPNNVYVAAFNCALMEYDETKLEVMNIDEDTWNISTDEKYIMSLDSNSAILIVHNIGNIINVPKLKLLRPDIIFVEDNCEGIFGKYENYFTGTSDATLCTSFSFFGNKTITCGEGGAIICSDEDVYNFLYKTCHQGITNKRYIHGTLGYNYRITNIQAAFLYDQLCDISTILDMKKKVFMNYQILLNDIPDNEKYIKLQKLDNGTEKANWIFALRIINNPSYSKFEEHMNSHGVDVRPMFYPIHTHTHLNNIDVNKSCHLSVILNQECLMLPSSPTLSYYEQTHIVNQIKSYINKYITKNESTVDSNIPIQARLGIGDILIHKMFYDRYKLKNNIVINLDVIAHYRNNEPKYLEFVNWLVERLFGKHKIIYTNSEHNFNLNYDNHVDEFNITSVQQYFNLDPLDNFSDDYIVIHSKCRWYGCIETYYAYKNILAHFFSNFKSKYKIVILGERVVSPNAETFAHSIDSLYDELMLLKNNNHIIDMTEQELYNVPNSQVFMRDIKIIHNAKVNIGFGIGGNLIIACAFSKNIEFLIDDEIPLVQTIYQLNNPKYGIYKNVDSFIEKIKQY